MTDLASKIARAHLLREGTPVRVAARFVEAKKQDKEAKGYAIGPNGLEETATGIALQKGCMYGLGASSSPQRVVVMSFDDERVKFRQFPFQGSDQVMQTWIFKDLATKGTKTLLRTYGASLGKKLKSSMESLLAGGKGRKEKLDDYKPITVEAEATDPTKDEWRAAEAYGNVGGLQKDDGTFVYQIDMYQKELADLKKDTRFKVIDVKDRKTGHDGY